jgi:hypothetical protein
MFQIIGSTPPNFSYDIVSGTTIEVPTFQQMSVWDELLLDNDGELVISGNIVLLRY